MFDFYEVIGRKWRNEEKKLKVEIVEKLWRNKHFQHNLHHEVYIVIWFYPEFHNSDWCETFCKWKITKRSSYWKNQGHNVQHRSCDDLLYFPHNYFAIYRRKRGEKVLQILERNFYSKETLEFRKWSSHLLKTSLFINSYVLFIKLMSFTCITMSS